MLLYLPLTTRSSASELIDVHTSMLWIALMSSKLDSHVFNIINGTLLCSGYHQRRVMHCGRSAQYTPPSNLLKLGTGYLLPEAKWRHRQGCEPLKVNSRILSSFAFSLCCTYVEFSVLPWNESMVASWEACLIFLEAFTSLEWCDYIFSSALLSNERTRSLAQATIPVTVPYHPQALDVRS